MAPVVVIPQDYEDLSYTLRKQIIPICIAAFDQYDQPIAPEWFSRGVAPVREQLVQIADYALGDPWCVSELAEATVHKLWERYGSAVGRYPARRVLKRAMFLAVVLRAGDWRKGKFPNRYVALDALDQNVRDLTLADPTEYDELFEKQIMLNSVEDRLKGEGRDEMRLVYQLIRRGYSWKEVAQEIGDANPERVKRGFNRWVEKRPGHESSRRLPPKRAYNVPRG